MAEKSIGVAQEWSPRNSPVFVEPCYIRARHQYAFRSCEWALLSGVLLANKRACFSVTFDDGTTDLWPVDDPVAGYEFSAKRFHTPAT